MEFVENRLILRLKYIVRDCPPALVKRLTRDLDLHLYRRAGAEIEGIPGEGRPSLLVGRDSITDRTEVRPLFVAAREDWVELVRDPEPAGLRLQVVRPKVGLKYWLDGEIEDLEAVMTGQGIPEPAIRELEAARSTWDFGTGDVPGLASGPACDLTPKFRDRLIDALRKIDAIDPEDV